MRKLLGLIFAISAVISTAPAASANLLPASFVTLANSTSLTGSGVIFLDPVNEGTLFDQGADIPRAPASVLKLVSMVTAVKGLGADKVFHTGIYTTENESTFILKGDGDPWMTVSKYEAKKYHRAFLPGLVSSALALNPKLKSITLKTDGVYLKDISKLKTFYRKRVLIKSINIKNSSEIVGENNTLIKEVTSPSLKEIVQFTLLWSDNVLADRLARTSAARMGFGGDTPGINLAFQKTLTDLNISTTGLEVFDGSGLSHETRITARTIADLLVLIKKEEDLKLIYDGLPSSGETGTLKRRFVKDAKSAVGLVKAKTGWINTSVSLAGYVSVGNEEYVFAIIADKIKPIERNRALARTTIDKMLATIAKPTEKTEVTSVSE